MAIIGRLRAILINSIIIIITIRPSKQPKDPCTTPDPTFERGYTQSKDFNTSASTNYCGPAYRISPSTLSSSLPCTPPNPPIFDQPNLLYPPIGIRGKLSVSQISTPTKRSGSSANTSEPNRPSKSKTMSITVAERNLLAWLNVAATYSLPTMDFGSSKLPRLRCNKKTETNYRIGLD